MANLRYALIEQLHFAAADPDCPARNVVVTIQRWRSKTSKVEVYARIHNGEEHQRHLADTDALRARIDASFATARRDFADRLLSDDAAADLVARHGGPHIKYCTTGGDCSAQIPFASGQCAQGHAVHHVNPGQYVMGSGRRPAITVITGGKQ